MTTAAQTTPNAPTSPISPAELAERLGSSEAPLMLDVRTPAEYESVRLPGAHNVPLDMLENNCRELAEQLEGELVLICQSGNRASQAKQHLQQVGVESVRVLDGGMAAMEENHEHHTRRANNRWAMDRQVRLVAGSLVLTGFLGSKLISPKLGYLAGAIGAGLTFSALTNSCAMASALQKMPWNQVEATPDLQRVMAEIPTSIQVTVAQK